MKMYMTLLTCLLGWLPVISQAANNKTYQCQQVCGYTASGPVLSFLAETESEAKQIVIDSCTNMGRTLQGEMQCKIIDYGGTTHEAYEECKHGTVNGSMFACRTYGIAYVLEKGKETSSMESRWNISRCSFAESEVALQADCDRLAANFPNAEIRCITKYQFAEYAPVSSPPICH